MIATGLIGIMASTYQDVTNLKAEQLSIQGKINNIDKKVNELHWFLIKGK